MTLTSNPLLPDAMNALRNLNKTPSTRQKAEPVTKAEVANAIRQKIDELKPLIHQAHQLGLTVTIASVESLPWEDSKPVFVSITEKINY